MSHATHARSEEPPNERTESLRSVPTDLPPLRDVAFVAAYLKKSPKYVREHAREFGGFVLGRRVMFTDSGIAAAISALSPEPTPARPTAGLSPTSAARFLRRGERS